MIKTNDKKIFKVVAQLPILASGANLQLVTLILNALIINQIVNKRIKTKATISTINIIANFDFKSVPTFSLITACQSLVPVLFAKILRILSKLMFSHDVTKRSTLETKLSKLLTC